MRVLAILAMLSVAGCNRAAAVVPAVDLADCVRRNACAGHSVDQILGECGGDLQDLIRALEVGSSPLCGDR